MQFGKFVDNSLTVGGIGHTEPAGVRIKYANGSFAVVDKSVDAQGNEEFSFGRVDVAFEEFDKFALAEVEIVGSESPEVHRYRSVGFEGLHFVVFVGKDDVVFVVVADSSAFHY